MNSKLIFTLGAVGAVVLAFGGQAKALGIYGGTEGNLQVGGNVSAQANTTLHATTSVQATTNVSGGLNALIQAGTAATSPASENAIIKLEGNADALIQSDADLTAYDNLVIKTRPAVIAINEENDGNVSVEYSQPAKFFGIFPASLSAEVVVDVQGNTSISLPWWAIFYTKDTASVQSSVATAVQQSGANFSANANANTSGALREKARVINAITAALEAQAEARTAASATAQ